MSLGRWGGLPFKLGGTRSDPARVEYGAMLDALQDAYDPAEGTYHEIETFAHARAAGMVWSAGKRLANQALPMKMLEMLPVMEEILHLTPAPGTTDIARRQAVAGKMRGLQGNALPDVEAVCAAVMGANYEEVLTVAPEDVVAYWPGGIPGPPGFEWASNEATYGVRVNRNGLSDSEFLLKVGRLREQLKTLLPSWMTFTIGVGSSFVVAQSIVGIDML